MFQYYFRNEEDDFAGRMLTLTANPLCAGGEKQQPSTGSVVLT